MKSTARWRLLGFIVVAAVLHSGLAAGESYPDYAARGNLTGELHSVGTDVMDTMTLGWLEIFRKAHPQVAATIEARVASSAFAGLMSGQGQVAPISRSFSPKEVAAFAAKFGHPPTEILVSCGAYDTPGYSPPIVMYVHKGNPLRAITLAQIEGMYAKDGGITTWGQIGLEGDWADKRIVVWGLRPPNGTATFFQEAAMHRRNFRPDLVLRPVASDLSRSAQRTPTGGVQAFTDIISGVAGDRYAIGYAAPADAAPGVKRLAVAPGANAAAIDPTPGNVADLSYPLCRFTYIYVNRTPGEPLDPNVKEFLRIVLSRQGQDVVRRRSPFLPLPPEIVLRELAKLE